MWCAMRGFLGRNWGSRCVQRLQGSVDFLEVLPMAHQVLISCSRCWVRCEGLRRVGTLSFCLGLSLGMSVWSLLGACVLERETELSSPLGCGFGSSASFSRQFSSTSYGVLSGMQATTTEHGLGFH